MSVETFLLNSKTYRLLRLEATLLGFGFRKRDNSVKIIRNYIEQRAKEKKILNDQIKILETQLKDGSIDEDIYERSRDIIEIQFLIQRDERIEKAFTKK
jgi:hypothetical protein